jgi:hypothetical protein
LSKALRRLEQAQIRAGAAAARADELPEGSKARTHAEEQARQAAARADELATEVAQAQAQADKQAEARAQAEEARAQERARAKAEAIAQEKAKAEEARAQAEEEAQARAQAEEEAQAQAEERALARIRGPVDSPPPATLPTRALSREERLEEEQENRAQRAAEAKDRMLVGLQVPAQIRRPWDEETREVWLHVISTLQARGMRTSAQLRNMTGLSGDSIAELRAELERGEDLSAADVRRLRARVARQTDAIADEAWRRGMGEDLDAKDQVRFLQLALAAGKARLDASGISRVEVELMGEASIKVDVRHELNEKLGLTPDMLAAIGSQAAATLSEVQRKRLGIEAEEVIIEAEAVALDEEGEEE